MEANAQSITYKVVALTIILLVIVSVAIPTIQDSQKSFEEAVNNSDLYFSSMISGDHTFSIASSVVTVDGEEITNIGTYTIPAIITDTGDLLPISNGSLTNLRMYDAVSGLLISGSYINSISISIDADEKVITIESATATSQGSAPAEGTEIHYNKYCFVVANSGDYVAYAPTTGDPVTLKVNDTDQIFAMAVNNTGAAAFYGDEKYATSSVTNSELAAELTKESDYYNLYSFEMSNTAADSDVTVKINGTAERTAVIVPHTIKAITDGDGSAYVLIGIIPLLLIICAVLFAVRMLGGSRN